MVTLLWAAAHTPTEEQLAELNEVGTVVYLKEQDLELYNAITNITADTNYIRLVHKILKRKEIIVQPAGNPMFQFLLGSFMTSTAGISEIWYSFSERVSEDVPQADGSVKKISIFKHLKFDKVII